MAQITITSETTECDAVLAAIQRLNANRVAKHMSYAMLASETQLTQEKVRLVISDLLAAERIRRIVVGGTSRVPRYYYVCNTGEESTGKESGVL